MLPGERMESTQSQPKHPVWIRAIVKWLQSDRYPVVYALLCAISGLFGKEVYLPIISIIAVLVIFSTLFAEDLKVILVPFFMTFYIVGVDNPEYLTPLREHPIGVFDLWALVTAICIGVVMFFFVCLRLYRDGILRGLFRQKRLWLSGILALDAAYLLAGLFCMKWKPIGLMNGILFALGITVCYLIFSHIIAKCDKKLNNYVCLCMICSAGAVLLQTVITMLRMQQAGILFLDAQDTILPQLNREDLQMAWGYATNMAGIMILGIPASLYLAKNGRYPLLSFLAAFVFLGGAVITGTRTATLVGGAVLVFCLLLVCIKGDNKKRLRLYTLIVALLAVALLLYVDRNVASLRETIIPEFLKFMRLTKEDISGTSARFRLWENSIADFLQAPVFGVGFADGGYTQKSANSNVFNDMYHNVFCQFLGAMGTVGVLAFLWHIKDILLVLFRRPSLDRLLLFMVPITILAASLADNFFFYFNFQIFYAAYLALAERHLSDSLASCALQKKNI